MHTDELVQEFNKVWRLFQSGPEYQALQESISNLDPNVEEEAAFAKTLRWSLASMQVFLLREFVAKYFLEKTSEFSNDEVNTISEEVLRRIINQGETKKKTSRPAYIRVVK